jgi:catechol 2,3-dioxygenase-like lactoylglutathione lyase family enzyme
MIDHVSLRVTSFTKALPFYTEALAPLGCVPQYVDAAGKSAGFGPEGAPCLWIAEGAPAPKVHVALRAVSRGAVAEFYAAGLRAGGKDHGKPGPRPDYGPTYFAAFVLDPDGNNLEAVTHAAR